MSEKKPLGIGSAGGPAELNSGDTIPATNVPGNTVITQSQIAADTDNFTLTGFADADIIRISFDANGKAITGLTAWTNGKTKRFINVGANFGYFPCEHPDSSAANRIAGEIDYILDGYGCITFYYDSTSSRARVLQSTFNAADLVQSGRGQYFFVPPASTVQADHPFLGFSQASGSNGNTAPTSTLPGAWDIDTSSSSSGASSIYINKNNNGIAFFGTAHIVCYFSMYIPTISTSAQRFSSQVSITNNSSGTAANNNNSVGFRGDDTNNGGKFQFFSRDNAGTETTTDTGITIAANTIYRGGLFIGKARDEVRLFITDGITTYQGRITGNMPNAVLAGARAIIVKSIGTTSRILNVWMACYEIHV